MGCKIEFEHGFDQTKLNNYNRFFDFLIGKIAIESIQQGQFISFSSKMSMASINNIYEFVNIELEDILNDEGSFFNTDNQSIKDDISFILSKWEEFKDYHKSHFINKIEFIDSENEDESDEQMKSDQIQQSAWNRSDFKIRSLFLSIPKHIHKDGKIEMVIDETTGLPKMLDGNSLFNILSYELSNLVDEPTFNAKIHSNEFQERFPEMRYLLDMLPSSEDNSIAALQMKAAFYKSLSKSYIPLVGVWEKNGKIYSAPFSFNNQRVIREDWKNNFERQLDNDHIFPDPTTRENQILSLPKLSGKQTKEDIFSFLSILGITLSDAVYENKLETIKNIIFGSDNINGLYDSMTILLNSQGLLKNPLIYVEKTAPKEIIGTVINIRNRFNDLLTLESLYSTVSPTLSIKNANDDNQYAISEKNSFSVIVDYINHSTSIDDLYKYLPALKYSNWFKPGDQFFQKGSFWYDLLFNSEGVRTNVKLSLNNYSGFNAKELISRSTSKMNGREKLLMDLNAISNNHQYINIPRTSTSDTYYNVRLTDENGKQVPQLIEDKGDIDNQLFRYLYNELDRIRIETNKKYQDFDMFKDILNESTQKELIEIAKNKEEGKDYDLGHLYMDITKQIDDFFKKEEEAILSLVEMYKISPTEMGIVFTKEKKETVNGKEEIVKEFNWEKLNNYLKSVFINSVEFSTLMTGDPIYYKDFHKRIKGGLSTGQTIDNIESVEDYLQKTHQNTIAGTLGYDKRDNTKTIKTKTFEDSFKDGKKLINTIVDNYKKLGANVSDRLMSSLKKNYDGDGEGLNKSDGQGMVSLDFYRESLMRAANWSQYKEDAYNYEVLYYIKNVLKRELSELDERNFSILEKRIYTNPELYALPPLKMQMFGPYNNLEKHTLAMDKFSLAPILPTVAHSTNNSTHLDLIKQMAKGGFAYVKYESASKGYKFNINKFGEGMNLFEEVYPSLLKEQLRTASKVKELVTWGTQFRKLLFSGLFNSKESSPKLKELYNNYLSLLKDVAKEAQESLISDLGVELDLTDVNDPKLYIHDFERLVSKLQKQAEAQDLPNNIKEAIQINPDTKQLLNPFETTGATNVVMNLLFGLIDKNLRVWKTVGNQYIQVSNDTYEDLKFYELLKDKTTKAQCRVGFTGEFLKLLNLEWKGKKIGTLDNLNRLLKDKEFRKVHEKSLNIVAYRIPTQEINSIENLEIVQFLPPTAGNIIHLYDEITGKSGSDFDIDKLSIFLPSFYENGEYLESIKGENLKENYENLKKDKKDYYKEVKNYIKALRQEIKDINKLNKEEISKLKDNLQLLKAERAYYIELIKLELDNRDSFNSLSSDSDLYERSSKLIDEIFNRPDYLSKVEFDNDIMKFFEKIQEIDNLYNDIKENYNIYDLIKQDNLNTIQEVKNKFIEDSFNKSDEIRKALERLRNSKNILTNSLIELYNEVFSQPEAYLQLVKPNSADILNDIAQHMASLDPNKKFTKGLPTNSGRYSYSSNLDMHIRLKIAGSHLGIFATTNTSHAIANQIGLRLNPFYRVRKKGKEAFVELQLGLLTDDEKGKVYDKEGNVIMDSNYDITGQSIQEIIGQGITITVDAEKNPGYSFLNINDSNIGIFNYLLRQRVPVERIIAFFSLPSVKKYFELKTLNPKKIDFPELEMYDKNKYVNINSQISLFQNESNPQQILEDNIKNPLKDIAFQATALELAKRFEREAKLFTSFAKHFVYDTRKIKTPIAVLARENEFKNIVRNGLITDESLEAWRENSIISVFNNSKSIGEISKSVFPVISNKDILSNFLTTISISKEDRLKKEFLQDILIQDSIQFIIENYGEYNGQKIGELGYDLLLSSNSILHDLSILEIPEEFKHYDIFKIISSEKKNGFLPLKILRSNESNSNQVNSLTQELENLINSEDEQISDIFKKFCIIAIKQGFSKSRFFIEDIVPLSFKQDIYQKAIEEYMKDPILNDGFSYGEEFEKKFLSNYKDRFFSDEKKIHQDQNAEFMKDYYIRDIAPVDKLPTETDEVLENKEHSISKKIYSMLPNKTESGNIQIKSIYQQEGVNYAKSIGGIFSLRVDSSKYHFGNQFSSNVDENGKLRSQEWKNKQLEKYPDLIFVDTVQEAVESYLNWVINSQDERAAWIRDTIKSGILQNKPIVYYKELGQPSHANALDYLINVLYRTKEEVKEINTPLPVSKTEYPLYPVNEVIEYKKVNKSSIAFYSKASDDITIERKGKIVDIEGFPDFVFAMEQNSNDIYELSTGLNIPLLYEKPSKMSQSDVIKNVAKLLSSKNGRDVIKNSKKIGNNIDLINSKLVFRKDSGLLTEEDFNNCKIG